MRRLLNAATLRTLRTCLSRFGRHQGGNFAIITALTAIPVFGLSGLALDYARAIDAKTQLQSRSDAIALAIASHGPAADSAVMLAGLLKQGQNDTSMGSATYSGRWINPTDYVVDASLPLALTISQIIPGAGQSRPVGAQSTARYIGMTYVYKPPEYSQLDPEAGDYNRVYAYCYDQTGKNGLNKGRTQITAIADNGGTKYNAAMPVCRPGEMLSYQLYNSRNARTNKLKWDNPLNENYSYYTDTTTDNQNGGIDEYALDQPDPVTKEPWKILETVLCPSLEKCVGKSKGGVLPEGKNRTPQRAKAKCSSGMYMYYGWEDRPPGRGSSDQDYDDIRVIVKCPELVSTGEENARLVQ